MDHRRPTRARTATRAAGARARVLTGIGTVLADDPSLDVRLVETARQPLRCVVDARLDTPPTARLFDSPSPVLLFTASHRRRRGARRCRRAAPRSSTCRSDDGRLDLAAVLDALAARHVNELHVEAGARLNGALLQTGRVDELLLYLAPTLLGAGRDMATLGPVRVAGAGPGLRFPRRGESGR